MWTLEPQLLQAAVVALCPDVVSRTKSQGLETDETRLWDELSTCLLSSQVPYDVAVAASQAVQRSGILLDPSKMGVEFTAKAIENVLRTPVEIAGRRRCYRFYTSKSKQLARTCHTIYDSSKGLGPLLSSFENEQIARSWFVENAPGLGPKQASMFLRNSGFTYQLAVLDRHVLNYMEVLQLDVPRPSNSLRWYYGCERSLQDHARTLGYPVGLLDWAIWIVMRVARGMKNSTVSA